MAVFLGKFVHTIDDKHRVSLPARFRDELAAEESNMVAIFIGFEHCLAVYPKKAAQDFKAFLDGKQFQSKEQAAAFKRLLTSTASLIPTDGQGRITLTEEQRQWAGLKKEIVIVGHFDRMEIWDPERFEGEVGKVDRDTMRDLAGEFFNDSKNTKS